MAERKRPGDDADRPGDETFDDAVAEDDAAADEIEVGDEVSRGGGTAVRERTENAEKPRSTGRRGGRIGGFFREVVSELRKVIWPTRKELLTYTGVVIGFVTVMTAIVAVLDYGFGKAILASFGN